MNPAHRDRFLGRLPAEPPQLPIELLQLNHRESGHRESSDKAAERNR